MRIGIFAASLGGGPSLTGVNTYSLALVESLYKYDTENEYVLILSELNRPFYEHITENERWKKIFVKPILVEDFSVFKKIYRVAPMFLPFTEYLKFDYTKTGFVSLPLNIINSLDLIHYTVFHSCSSIPFFVEKPFVVTLHDLRLFYPEFSKKPTDKLYFTHLTMKKIFKKVAQKSSKIITEVPFVKEDIIRFLNTSYQKIEVLVSPLPDIYTNRLSIIEDLSKVKAKYSLPDKYIFYPATLASDKNHERLLLAIKMLRDKGVIINLILAGSDNGMLGKIMAMINSLGLKENVKYLGFVPLEDLVSLYQLSHGVIVPTLFESVSLPVWEAMILGKPVATSNICGMPYQLGDLGIYFDPYDVESISNGILKLWELKVTETLSQNLKNRAQTMLDKKKYAESLIKIYKEVKNGK